MTSPAGADLLDVSVLLALLDPDHDAADRAHAWFARSGSWATCPITEIGFVRVVSQPRYPRPVSSVQALATLTAACQTAGHEFWPCDITLRTSAVQPLGPSQLTDVYLLSLCVARSARFVTLDTAVNLRAVPGATPSHLAVL